MRKIPITLSALAMLAASGAAHGDMYFSATQGNLSASVNFHIVNSNTVEITLTNTSTADAMVQADILTAVFFDIDPTQTLTRVSAVLAPGSTVFDGGTDPGAVVGGEWAYKSGFTSAPGNAGLGISSSGLDDLFGPGDRFPGSDLQPPASPDGVQYGITSAGDDFATGNPALTTVDNKNALIKNAVVFTMNYTSPFTVSNVSFQYGTSLDEPNIVVPAPGAALLGLIGLAAVGRVKRWIA